MKMFLMYAHEDRPFLVKSRFMAFLRAVARDENLELWWDEALDHPLWDDEIKRQLQEADVFVCLLSQPFLDSDYITNIEAKRAYGRLKREGTVVVPVLYQDCTWDSHAWLRKVNHVPETAIYGRPNQPRLFLEVARYIKKLLGRAAVFHDTRAQHTLRNLSPESLTARQRKLLEEDSVRRAGDLVKDKGLQRRICNAAKKLLAASQDKWLSKEQLMELDERFLAKGNRKADPMKVRWVLRAHGLHPQTRVYKK